jgi:hypothetical protein
VDAYTLGVKSLERGVHDDFREAELYLFHRSFVRRRSGWGASPIPGLEHMVAHFRLADADSGAGGKRPSLRDENYWS